ncbi:MAG: sigma 54-interacting transcriptional regulator [Spirochaetales bacterium]|nr:sigma 54-interacting transcriptional regulator [Spirochaetales bacterium]MCF7938023.1 sigma 54-interacting transcriptional regulator [Spirochaetales bacterium]
MNKNLLFAWIGATDLEASKGRLPEDSYGPIADVVRKRHYDSVYILNNYQRKDAETYRYWLRQTAGDSPPSIHLRHFALTSPTDFSEIYKAVVSVCSEAKKRYPDANYHFHLSPGTPAMSTVWILLANTKYPADLLESSRESGIKTVELPFTITAEYRLPKHKQQFETMVVREVAEGFYDIRNFGDVIYSSDEMKTQVIFARRFAQFSVPVLLLGESGTGKEVFARAIHSDSERRDGNFVPVNCGAIPGELLESELFGYKKGAFTGADKNKPGYIEQAAGGTIFLDEIAELPQKAQVKLLRFLQEGEIQRLGDTKRTISDARIIAATNRDLNLEVEEGRFREDLFHRITIGIIQIPPLRRRREDIPLFVRHILSDLNNRYRDSSEWSEKSISGEAVEAIKAYSWPGNVRELLNTITRAAIFSRSSSIGITDIEQALIPTKRNSCNEDIYNRPLDDAFNIRDVLGEIARHYLKKALKEAGGNKTRASKLVGLANYQTFTNWCKDYGLE